MTASLALITDLELREGLGKKERRFDVHLLNAAPVVYAEREGVLSYLNSGSVHNTGDGVPDVDSGDEIADPIGTGDVKEVRICGAARIPDLLGHRIDLRSRAGDEADGGTAMAAGDGERAADATARASYQYVGVGQGRSTHRERTAKSWVRVWTWLVSRPHSLEGIRVVYYPERGAGQPMPPVGRLTGDGWHRGLRLGHRMNGPSPVEAVRDVTSDGVDRIIEVSLSETSTSMRPSSPKAPS